MTKCPLKKEVLLDADGHVPKFGIFQNTVAPNCSKLLMFWFFLKKRFCLMSDLKITLSNVTSFLPDSLSGLKKYYIQVWTHVRLSIKQNIFFCPVFPRYFPCFSEHGKKQIRKKSYLNAFYLANPCLIIRNM